MEPTETGIVEKVKTDKTAGTPAKRKNAESKKSGNDFTEGSILAPLIRFALPILLSLFLQAMYGAVDLIIVGKFCATAEISGVSTGSQFMNSILSLLYGFAVAITVVMGQKIGEGDRQGVKKALSAGMVFFAVMGVVMTAVIVGFTDAMTGLMNTPEEAHDATFTYIRICGAGCLFILAYNLIGSIFRGVGDSATPLITVAIATVVNIAGDLFAVGVLGLGAAGAALATVAAQLVSVLLSFAVISGRKYDFMPDSLRMIRPYREYLIKIVKVGAPLSLQETLVTISFLVIAIIVNSLGVAASAAAGIGGKICNIIMLLSSACMQALSAFTAQNVGAGQHDRAKKALKYLIACSFAASIVVAYFSYFHGNLLAGLFANDAEVVAKAWDYLRAYSIDSLLTSFLFCFLGYYNGYARTRFVMLQGLIGAFGVRIPAAYLMSRTADPTLFKVALATPMSSVMQIILCLAYYFVLQKKINSGKDLRA